MARESKPIPTKRPERTRRWFRKAKTDKEGGSEARTSHHSDTEHQLPPDVSTEETSVLQEGFSSISTSEQLQSPSDQIMKTPQRCSSAHPTSVKDAPVDREHVQRGISLAPGVVDGPAESTEAHSRNVEKTDVFMQGSEENSSHSQTMQGFPELRIPQLGEQSERSFSLATGDVMTHIEGNHHSHNSSTSGREAPMVHGNTFDEDMPPLDDNLPLENFVEDTGSNEVVAQADSHVEATPELIDSNARSRHERSYSFSSVSVL